MFLSLLVFMNWLQNLNLNLRGTYSVHKLRCYDPFFAGTLVQRWPWVRWMESTLS